MIPEFPIPPGVLIDQVETRIYDSYSTPEDMSKALESAAESYGKTLKCSFVICT